ncbi:MAG: RNA polymerase sigma factor [Bacillota bacterium]
MSDPNPELDNIILRARSGDLSAFDQLFLTFRDDVYRLAYSVTRRPEDAEDITQNTFVRLFSAIQRFRQGEPFRPWLLGVTIREARGYLRRVQRWRRKFERAVALVRHSEMGYLSAPAPAVAIPLPDLETTQIVHEAVATLNPEQRTVVTLRYYFDLSLAEMSNVLGVPLGTVKSRLHYAQRRLREELEANSDHGADEGRGLQ